MSGDDGVVVEGVDEHVTLLALEPARLLVRVLEHRAGEYDLRAVSLGRRHFDEGRRLRRDDDRLHSQTLCVIRHARRVVPRAGRDHSATTLLRRQEG